MHCNPIQPFFLAPLMLTLALGWQNLGFAATQPGQTQTPIQAQTPSTQIDKASKNPIAAPNEKPTTAKPVNIPKPAAAIATPGKHPKLKTPVSVIAPPKTVTTDTRLDPKKYYLVKTGDSLYSISVKTGQIFQNLAQWNYLPSPYQVREGQILKLFQPPAPPQTNKTQANTTAIKKNRDGIQKTTIFVTKKPSTPVIIKPQKSQSPVTIGKTLAIEQKTPNISIANKKMLKSGFKWPINGRVIKGFTQTNNQGIDIENKSGKQPVLAAQAGLVVYTGQGLSNLKNLIIIKHSGDYLTAYSNNSRVIVNEDQQVKTGQRIAEIVPPNNKPSVLHFQIRKNGIPVNPLKLLPK
ncbi:MAG: peptidoglycan DD-metalloendopeptidase family protein [Methylovulum sp.]|uniref:peptidoglycan DD-metalloendopeptidase family protein n=1 Tax=Methylovulum sp. TaxID=1916980 RepID=UPI002615D27D|nr:peptidoglycan DD-metalloendopeptidase family protein [Methylovulum sp.]MDD2722493.1 peptidoglycan DD-metalloendopeptidase family protein [Methylovulum sp.]MDD5126197.1 peptidoglycan DD-metalloendopeptidase family protein [Methylovulum sp.]